MSFLSLDHFSVTLGKRRVINDISFSIHEGEVVGLIGPNGAGKTSLMRAALGLIPSHGYSSLLDYPSKKRAAQVAWMPQNRVIAWPVTVETLIMLGRVPHLAAGQKPSDQDHAILEEVIAELDLEKFRHNPATELSGGEQARVLLARAMAQKTPLIMADEPIAGLDPAYQIMTMKLFASLAKQGKSTLVSLHDLSLAGRYCSRLILIGDKHIIEDGPPEDVLRSKNIEHIFGIRAKYEKTDEGIFFQVLEMN